jgi:hypothetical protein
VVTLAAAAPRQQHTAKHGHKGARGGRQGRGCGHGGDYARFAEPWAQAANKSHASG